MKKKRPVNIAIVTYNRLPLTQMAIQSVLDFTDHPYILTVVDNHSLDGTRDYLIDLKRKGAIKNLFLLDENIGIAKASNIAWLCEAECPYYLKLDNDIIIQKKCWLGPMVSLIDCIKTAGAVAYNFERDAYPVSGWGKYRYQLKKYGNLGGACLLIPERTRNLLGYWCEEYGMYGEEDADYCTRMRCARLKNIYMKDCPAMLHHPALNKPFTAVSASKSDSRVLTPDEYRGWKEKQRNHNIRKGLFAANCIKYATGEKSLYTRPHFAETYLAAMGFSVPESLFTPTRSLWWRIHWLSAEIRGLKI